VRYELYIFIFIIFFPRGYVIHAHDCKKNTLPVIRFKSINIIKSLQLTVSQQV